MQGKKHDQDKRIPSFRLSERVPKDNFYRRLKEVLDLEWLYEATQKYYGREGHPSIDPVVFFKLILIGYLENLLSDRRIIQTVSLRLDLLYFTGYSLDEPLPWHSTISRTRQLLGEEVFPELFKRVLHQCVQRGMVKGRRQAMDSVHVKANASMSSLKEKEIVQDADAYASELSGEEDSSEEGLGGGNTVSAYKYQEVQWHHGWKKKAYRGQVGDKVSLKRRTGEAGHHGFVSNHTHYCATDRDARIAVKPGKLRQLNYLGQLSVDTAHHVITGIQADLADKKDSQCLPSLLTGTIDNLKAEGLKVREVLADAAYSSPQALRALKQQHITGYIPNFGLYKPERKGFRYFPGGDYYKCSRGVKLPFKGITGSHGGVYQVRVYRSSSRDCRDCPLKMGCIGKSDFKKIADTVDKALYDEMHERFKKPKARRMQRLRQATAEPVLGTLINFLGMRRLNTRGINLANKCMLMAGCAYNLKRLLKWTSEEEPEGGKTLFQPFITLWLLLVQGGRKISWLSLGSAMDATAKYKSSRKKANF